MKKITLLRPITFLALLLFSTSLIYAQDGNVFEESLEKLAKRSNQSPLILTQDNPAFETFRRAYPETDQLLALDKKQAKQLKKRTNKGFDGDNPLVPIPRVISSEESASIQRGIGQMAKTLKLFMQDLRTDPKAFDSQDFPLPKGILKKILQRSGEYQLYFGGANKAGRLKKVEPAFTLGPDLIRGPDGRTHFLELNPGYVGGLGDLVVARQIFEKELARLRGESELELSDKFPELGHTHQFFDDIAQRLKQHPKTSVLARIPIEDEADNETTRLTAIMKSRGIPSVYIGKQRKKLNPRLVVDKDRQVFMVNKNGKRTPVRHIWSDAEYSDLDASKNGFFAQEMNSDLENLWASYKENSEFFQNKLKQLKKKKVHKLLSSLNNQIQQEKLKKSKEWKKLKGSGLQTHSVSKISDKIKKLESLQNILNQAVTAYPGAKKSQKAKKVARKSLKQEISKLEKKAQKVGEIVSSKDSQKAFQYLNNYYDDYKKLNSKIGIKGLAQAIFEGKVSVVNGPGINFIDDKEFSTYMDDLIRFYLKEEPVITGIPSRSFVDAQGQLDRELMARVFDHKELYQFFVVKKVDGRGGDGVYVGPFMSSQDFKQVAQLVRDRPNDYLVQQYTPLARLTPEYLSDMRGYAFVDSTLPSDRDLSQSIIISPTFWGRAAADTKAASGKVNISLAGGETVVLPIDIASDLGLGLGLDLVATAAADCSPGVHHHTPSAPSESGAQD